VDRHRKPAPPPARARNLTDPTDVAFFYAYLPVGRPATLPTLVAVAGRRWLVEEDFQVGKDQFGLDHSQVRLYTALLRHLALTMIAPGRLRRGRRHDSGAHQHPGPTTDPPRR